MLVKLMKQLEKISALFPVNSNYIIQMVPGVEYIMATSVHQNILLNRKLLIILK